MPTEADHIALANKNHDVLQHLMQDPERFPEWIVTTAFYKAVQLVEAVFANHGHRQDREASASHT